MTKRTTGIHYRSLQFSNKAAARKHFEEIKQHYQVGEQITVHEHIVALTDLLLLQHDPDETGDWHPSVQCFVIGEHPFNWRMRDIQMVGEDGTLAQVPVAKILR